MLNIGKSYHNYQRNNFILFIQCFYYEKQMFNRLFTIFCVSHSFKIMKEIGMSILMAAIYVAIWKVAGFEVAVCGGIGQIIAAITFKNK